MWQAGGAAEALIEQYNDQLREIRERGLADTDAAEPLRELLRALRAQPRITEGSVKVCRPSSYLVRGACSVIHQILEAGLSATSVWVCPDAKISLAPRLMGYEAGTGVQIQCSILTSQSLLGLVYGCHAVMTVCLQCAECGSPVQVPDVAELQRPQDVKLEEGLAGVVKVGFKNLLNLTSYV